MKVKSIRRWLSVLTFAAFLAGLLATTMVFAQDRIFDADSFSTTAAATLTEPVVNDYLAQSISDALIEQAPDLAIVAPALEQVTGSVLESDAALRVVESATLESHQLIFAGGEDSLVLDLSDLVVSIEQALMAVSPELAEVIPEEVTSLAVDVSAGDAAPTTVRFAERMRVLTLVLVVLALVLLVALVVIEPSLFGGLTRMGLVLGSIGLSLKILLSVGAIVVGSYGRTELESDALTAAWNLVLGDLGTWGWALIAAGTFLAGLGWAVLNSGHFGAGLRRMGERVTLEPESTVARICLPIAGLAVAAWALFDPLSLLGSLTRVAGFGLMIAVVAGLVDASGLARRLSALEPAEADVIPLRSVGARAAVPAVAMIGLGVFGAVLLSANDDVSALFDPRACNGHVELCDRRLDEVTLATSHNAMSSTATGFYLPNHLSTMRAQLDQGVRGFMIDTVYGRAASNGTVRTSLGLVDVDTLDGGALAAAEGVQSRQGADLGEEAVYLCHGFCEIGALDAVDELRTIREWLEENQREVVVLVVQDATDPADTAAAFEEAGFSDLVLTQQPGEPFPTLGEMIDAGMRVFVMVEEDGAGFDWLHPAFEFSQETPFSFASAEEFSCAPNRGEGDNPLFVVNHFITLARPSNQTINDYQQLLDRAEACRDERGLQPNLIAVDFISEGDVMAVVDTLNGVD